MVNSGRAEAVAYHYAAPYRDIAKEVFERAGLTPLVYDNPDEAKSRLGLATKALIVPYEKYSIDEDTGNFQIERPSTELLRFSGLFEIPFALLTSVAFDVPRNVLDGAPPASIVMVAGENPTFTAQERIATAENPDPETLARVAFSLANWLRRIDKV